MFKNLEAEMARQKISRSDLAELLKVRYATVLDKMNGKSRFFYDEATRIKEAFFPELTLEYLFESEESEATDSSDERDDG